MDGISIDGFFDELEKLSSVYGVASRVGGWMRNQHHQLGVAASEALTDPQSFSPITGQTSPPVLSTLANFVANKLPAPRKPPGRVMGVLKTVASSKPIQTAVPILNQASEFMKLAKVEPYQQKTQYSCSAACLKSVLQHWGEGRFAEHEIMHEIGVHEKRGAEVDQITEAAKRMGFYAYDKSFSSLDEAQELTDSGVPIIADIQSFTSPGKGHYVVITAIDKENVTLMDPNVDGNTRIISKREMEDRWWDRRMKAPHNLMVRWGVVVIPRSV
jgi:predicted double-glycine peptidase